MQDTAQNQDQQSVNTNNMLEEGDILMTENTRSLLRNGRLGRQWDYHVIPYMIDFKAVDEKYHYWVKVSMLGKGNYLVLYRQTQAWLPILCLSYCPLQSWDVYVYGNLATRLLGRFAWKVGKSQSCYNVAYFSLIKLYYIIYRKIL